MAETTTKVINKPVWIDLATPDAAAARDFYSRLFGWQIEISPDPQYGGYGIANIGGNDAAGIGPKQSPEQPTVWSLYIGTEDVDGLANRITQAGGTVIQAPFDVGDQGRMAVFQDPTGAFLSAWQATTMRGFATDAPNSFGWAELNTADVEAAVPFYQQIFGWTPRRSGGDGGAPPYVEFQVDGQSVAGGQSQLPAGVPPHWLVYFNVDDVDAAFQRAIELGGREVVAPADYPGGRFAVLTDPQGATFGLLKTQTP